MKVAITKEFQDFIKNTGVSLEESLEIAGIPNLLWKEELDISPVDYAKFMFALDEKLTDDQIVAFSNVKNIKSFLPPLYASLCAKNALDGIDRFALYKRLVCPLVVNVERTEKIVNISMKYDLPVSTMPRFSLLSEQLVVLNMIRTGTGKRIVPTKVQGPYSYDEIISKELGVAPKFAQNNSIQFSLADMQKPFLTKNNIMWSYLEPELNRRINELAKEMTFTNLVEKSLYSAIPGNRYSREETAKSLGVSVRTMQRKLREDNTTYADMVQKVQEQLAINYIRINELSLEEISCLLGLKNKLLFQEHLNLGQVRRLQNTEWITHEERIKYYRKILKEKLKLHMELATNIIKTLYPCIIGQSFAANNLVETSSIMTRELGAGIKATLNSYNRLYNRRHLYTLNYKSI